MATKSGGAATSNSAGQPPKTVKTTPRKSNARLETKQEAANTKVPPKVQSRHKNYEKYIKALGSITKPSRDLGYTNGDRQTIDWLLPNQTGNLQILTRRLGFDRGGQTIDWLLNLASNEFLNLSFSLGFQYNGAETIKWLLQQAKPAIDNRIFTHNTQGYNHPLASPATVTSYPVTYIEHVAPPSPTMQFSQNPQPIRPGFAPTDGLGRGIYPTYTPTPRPQSGLGVGNALSIHNPSFNGFSGGQPQMRGEGQFQRAGMPRNSTGNTGGLRGGVGARVSMPMNLTQQGGSWNAQNHLPGMQQPVQISGTPLNHPIHMSSSTPAQNKINQIAAQNNSQSLSNNGQQSGQPINSEIEGYSDEYSTEAEEEEMTTQTEESTEAEEEDDDEHTGD